MKEDVPGMLRPDLTPHSLICIAEAIEATSATRQRLDDIRVSGVELDSRLVQPGDLFVALPGRTVHGAEHVAQALECGAVAVLTDATGAAMLVESAADVFVTTDVRKRLGYMASSVYRTGEGSPVRQGMAILAVTGTNGKTTVAHLIAACLQANGVATGLIGTIGIRVGAQYWPTARTTPESVHLHAALAAMAQMGVRAVALEASSHALAEGRLDGLVVDVAGYTNLSQDHLDYHGSMEEYFQAKAQLFTSAHARLGVVGIDDDYGLRLANQATIQTQTWSAGDDEHPSKSSADWRLVRAGADQWQALGPGGSIQVLPMPFPGAFNRANVLCAYAMVRSLGGATGLTGLRAAEGLADAVVPGRMEPVVVSPAQTVQAVVDYAHTPEAIGRVLQALREQQIAAVQGRAHVGPSRLVAVVGAGGNRDREKRPAMGEKAATWADLVIVTDDNPREENPASIRAAVRAGAEQAGTGAEVIEIADRAEAIAVAVRQALPDGSIAILGKGHERTQEVAGIMHPFDDRAALAAALRQSFGDAHGISR
ncbi:MAG: UDP-N-acetylmuramoyl-L-alanyl-D-glutamate--2,6-diaminopimelate ligase [Actinomycetales bacterium]